MLRGFTYSVSANSSLGCSAQLWFQETPFCPLVPPVADSGPNMLALSLPTGPDAIFGNKQNDFIFLSLH